MELRQDALCSQVASSLLSIFLLDGLIFTGTPTLTSAPFSFLVSQLSITQIFKIRVKITHVHALLSDSLIRLDKNAHTPEIYSREGTDAFPYPSSVVFRLAAIRETFEEVGILICRKTDRASNLCDYDYDYEQLSDRKVVQAWQTKIRKSPEEFINLCVELKCVPDLNALSDWSEWLTPTSLKPKARFDTIFYMLILPKMPRVAYDTHEVASAQVFLKYPVYSNSIRQSVFLNFCFAVGLLRISLERPFGREDQIDASAAVRIIQDAQLEVHPRV